MNRRDFLETLGLCAGAGWIVAACGPSLAEPDGVKCSRVADVAPEDWVEVRLADHPELAAVGGSTKIDRPEDYLKVHVVHYRDGCFIAAARLCTHGACELDVSEVVVSGGEGVFACPCHGSQFGPDGRVVRGPAADPIATFDIQITEESLWIRPPQIG